MTKDKLLELLTKVESNARICIVLKDGTVVDIDEAYCAQSLEGFRIVDEVFLPVVTK